ncbi:unnamed protein product [Nezara viridula]|nr:unnamed protein product [Nezara viridula]
MEYLLTKEEEIIDNFNNDFDMLLPDDNFETKSVLDSSFLDSLIHDGISQWPEVFPQLSDLHSIDDDTEIKSEVFSPADSPSSINYCDTSSSSSDEKFTLETPPVSPPREEFSPCTPLQFTPREPTQKKSTVLKINPNNIKIIRNVKGLKPVGKQTQIVLPKDVLQKVMKCKTEKEISKPPVSSVKSHLSIGVPVILPSNHIQTPAISICPADSTNIKIDSISPPIAPAPFLKRESVDYSLKNDINLKALKRQQRMIKNRESACLSRKKKKEYVTALESKVSDLETENSHLKVENERLKIKIKELETGYKGFGKPGTFLNSNLRKTTAVLAVLFMVSINIGSIGLLSRESISNELNGGNLISPESGTKKHGRALLWAQPELQESAENITSSDSRSTCPLHINQTESLRLEKELRRWIEIGENNYKNETKILNNNIKPPPMKLSPHLKANNKVKSYKKAQRWQKGGTSAVGVYRPKFPGSLPRRDDTFYVFSFSSDHLLVPALAHDITLRPKMSFLIPTVPFNESVAANGSVPMMQVDCEVLATKSIEITEEDFRTFRPKQEGNSKINASSDVSMKELNYRPYFIGEDKQTGGIEDTFDGYLKRVYRTGSGRFP